MKLSNLVQDIKTEVKGKDFLSDQDKNLLEEVILPKGADVSSAELEMLSDYSIKWEDRQESPHITIMFEKEKTPQQIKSVMDYFFTEAQKLEIPKEIAICRYSFYWNPEDFLSETSLKGLFFDEIKLEARNSEIISSAPRNARINWRSHRLNVKSKGNWMSLTASGSYRTHLKEIIDELNPQLAKINFTQESAERLLRKLRDNPLNKPFVSRLESILQPKEQENVTFSLTGNVRINKEETIELTVMTKNLDVYSEFVGMPLLNPSPKQQTRVTELTKTYNPLELISNRKLKDLQMLAGKIPTLDVGIMRGQPTITISQAGELLQKDLENLDSRYHRYRGYINDENPRKYFLRRLASEHFGKNILTRIDNMDVSTFIDYLKSKQGYEELTDLEEGWGQDCETYGDYEDSLKHRHLLEAFKQSVSRDPRDSLEIYIQHYRNSPMNFGISTGNKKIDASKLRRIKIPSQAQLLKFGIEEYSKHKTAWGNDISIRKCLPYLDELNIFSRTSTECPRFLSLQSQLLDRMGVKFRPSSN